MSKSNQLISGEGYTLRNALDMGRPMTVDAAQDVLIGKDGTVSQGGQPVGQIEVGQIPSAAEQVSKLGNSYFALVDRAAAATRAPATEIQQGQLEQSNVPVADFAVRLVSVMRQFEMLERAMRIGSEMSKSAIQEVAKVS